MQAAFCVGVRGDSIESAVLALASKCGRDIEDFADALALMRGWSVYPDENPELLRGIMVTELWLDAGVAEHMKYMVRELNYGPCFARVYRFIESFDGIFEEKDYIRDGSGRYVSNYMGPEWERPHVTYSGWVRLSRDVRQPDLLRKHAAKHHVGHLQSLADKLSPRAQQTGSGQDGAARCSLCDKRIASPGDAFRCLTCDACVYCSARCMFDLDGHNESMCRSLKLSDEFDAREKAIWLSENLSRDEKSAALRRVFDERRAAGAFSRSALESAKDGIARK